MTDRTSTVSARDGFVEGMREIAPVAIGLIPFGLVVGVAAVENGLGIEGAMTASLLMFAGASQLAAMDLFGRDAPMIVIVLTVVVINARMAMYSAALAPVMAHEPMRRRSVVAYLLVDQCFAMTVGRDQREPGPGWHRYGYYVGIGVTLWVLWQINTLVGAVVGASIPDWLPLSAVIPFVFLAILVPAVTDRPTLSAAVVSGTVATLGAGLPANSGLLVGAVAGIAAGTVVSLRTSRPHHPADPGATS